MPDLVFELAKRGRTVSLEERAHLVDLPLVTPDDSAAAGVAEAWDRETERRIAAYRAGEVEAYDVEEVLAEARRLAP